MERMVPRPIPTRWPVDSRPMEVVMATFVISKQFLVSPTLFPEKSEMAWTMPSPGLGIRRMLRERAAPMLVNTMAKAKKTTCPGKVPQKVPREADDLPFLPAHTLFRLLFFYLASVLPKGCTEAAYTLSI